MENIFIEISIGIAIGFIIAFALIKRLMVGDEDTKTSKINNQSNFTVYMHDNEYTGMHLDENENIIAFISCNPNNIKSADFYFSLMADERIITIIYDDGKKERIYKTWITELKIIDENTLRIYYSVIR